MKKRPDDILKETAARFAAAGVPEPELDAWYLMEACFRMDRTHFLLDKRVETELPDHQWQRFCRLSDQRAKRVPLQQLLGSQQFMGLDFRVTDQVLIPRQDTEILVEQVLQDFRDRPKARLLDMCTGSGCILLSLLELGDFSSGTGADLSEEALAVARENGRRLCVEAEWIRSDLFSCLPEKKYDVIVSNPPYISGEELETLEPEVRDYEPRMALYAPENGLAFYRRLAEESSVYLAPGGNIYLEIGSSQAAEVSGFLAEYGYKEIRVIRDLAGLDRVVAACLPGKGETGHV